MCPRPLQGARFAAQHWKDRLYAEAATRFAMTSPPAPAVMVEIALLAVAPLTPQRDVALSPQQTESEPEPTPDTPAPVENAKPDPILPTHRYPRQSRSRRRNRRTRRMKRHARS